MANKFVVQYIIKARDSYSKVADKVARQTAKMKQSVESANSSFKKFSENTAKTGAVLSTAVTLPIMFAAKNLKNLARDAQETDSKFQTIFKSVSVNANKTANDLAKNYGLSSMASKKLLGDTGDLLSGFGFSGKASLDLSSKVQRLAVDLASFTNFSGGASGASTALTKALLGERESVKSLGIAILEKDVKEKVAQMRAKGMAFATDRQARAYATLDIAIAQSKNAVGDYARTKQNLANRERELSAKMENLGVSLGTILLPMFLKATNMAIKFAKSFGELSDSSKKTILVILGVAAVTGPLLILLAGVPFVIAGITAAFTALGAVTAVVFSPIAIAIAGVIAAGYLLIKNWELIKATVSTTLVAAGDMVINKWNSVKTSMIDIFKTISHSIQNSPAYKIFQGIKGGVSNAMDMFNNAGGSGMRLHPEKTLSGGFRTDANISVSLDKGLKENKQARHFEVSRYGAAVGAN